MINDDSNRLLMSDSIKGTIPVLEDDSERLEADISFFVGIFEFVCNEDIDVLAGKVQGISFEASGDIKVDIRLETKRAYDTIKKHATFGLSCRMFHLCHDDDELCFEGNYRISSTKTFDFDAEKKMCTLGFDLVKFDHN